MARQVYGAASRLLHALFPPVCVLCLEPGQPPALDLCAACEAELPRNENACERCAMPLPPAGCRGCRLRPPAFDAAFVPYRYEFPVAQLVQALKYRGQLPLGRALGTLLGRAALRDRRELPECILPVPLHYLREHRRGYNQAAEIARYAAAGRRIEHGLARRIRPTAEQAGLAARARRRNLVRAFRILGSPPPRIAIVDDVLTTGATAASLAAALKAAGAEWVELWAVARASGPGISGTGNPAPGR